MAEGIMKKHFRGVLPFVAYRIQLNGSREEIIDDLKRRVISFPLARYNFFAHGRPYQLLGQVGEDTFHLTTSVQGWNGGQTVLHGKIQTVDESSCCLMYRVFPNNFAILFLLMAVCICLFSHGTVWKWHALGVVILLSIVLYGLSVVQMNESLNETMREHME